MNSASSAQTPDRPDYPGGTWHVEGMANERIIASGIYYYDCENIAESYLAFRCAVNSDDIQYEQDDEAGMKRAYGLDRYAPVSPGASCETESALLAANPRAISISVKSRPNKTGVSRSRTSISTRSRHSASPTRHVQGTGKLSPCSS